MSQWEFLLVAVVVLALVRLLPILITWRNIMGKSLHYVPPVLSRSDEPPAHLAEIYRAAGEVLLKRGFTLSHSVNQPGIYDESSTFQQYYVNAASGTYAEVAPFALSPYPVPFQIVYFTSLSNGRLVYTTDGISSLEAEPLPNTVTADGFFGDPDKQLKLHAESVARAIGVSGARPLVRPPEEEVAAEIKDFQDAAAFRERTSLRRDREGLLRHRAAHALRITLAIFRAAKRRKAAFSCFSNLPPANLEASIQSDINTLEKASANERKKVRSWSGKLLLFALSVAVFTFAFSAIYSWKSVFIIVIVLLVHELGHLLAMKAFGNRDTSIYFIPMFGAITVGESRELSPLKRLTVYLMGPLPGIFIGIAAIVVSSIQGAVGWQETGFMFLIINYLNLLPVAPLDGGRIVELLIRHRFPRAPVYFLAMSAAALFAGAFLLHTTAIGVVGFLMLVTLPGTWRLSKAIRMIQPIIERTPDAKDLPRLIVDFTYHAPIDVAGKEGRLGLAKKLRAHFMSPRPGKSEAVKGTLLYVGALVSPAILLVSLLMGGMIARVLPMFSHSDPWHPALSDASTPAERRAAYLQVGQLHKFVRQNPDSAAAYYRLALAVAESAHLKDDDYLATLEWLASVEKDSVKADRYLARALTCAEDLSDDDRIADVLEAMADRANSPEAASRMIPLLQRAIRIRDAFDQGASVSGTKLRLASLYEMSGQMAVAESLLCRSAASGDTSTGRMMAQLGAVHALAEFYHRTRRDSLAMSLLGERGKQTSRFAQQWWSRLALDLYSHQGWIALRRGDTLLARQVFQENLASSKSMGEGETWGYSAIEVVLDVCSLELRQGHLDAAREQLEALTRVVKPQILTTRYGPRGEAGRNLVANLRQEWEKERWTAHSEVIMTLLQDGKGEEFDPLSWFHN